MDGRQYTFYTPVEGLTWEKPLKRDIQLAWDITGVYAGPLLCATLNVGYKVVRRTKPKIFECIRDKYELPEFDDDPKDQSHQCPRDTEYWLGEIWSYLK